MRFSNNNKEIIKRISKRSLKKNKIRNVFTIIAVILTTFLISSVFSIGISLIKNYRTMQIRERGTLADCILKNATDIQIERIKSLDICDSTGIEINAGKVTNQELSEKNNQIELLYKDNENFEKYTKPCISDIIGQYPSENDQIMISRNALKFLNKSDAKIGDSIDIKCMINNKEQQKTFKISGIYTFYNIMQNQGCILLSKEFIEDNNLISGNVTLNIKLKDKYKYEADSILKSEVNLNDGQNFRYTYDTSGESDDTIVTIGIITVLALFIVISGYLLIHNIIYISVTKDIYFYGLLKTIGASSKQIKAIVKRQSLILGVIGTVMGLIIGALASFAIVPLAMSTFSGDSAERVMPGDVSFNPIIFIISALFSLITCFLSSLKPAKIAANINPVEALYYREVSRNKSKKKRKSTNGGKLYKMAWYNVFRDKKRAFIVFLSLFMGIIAFLSVNTFLESLNVKSYIAQYIKSDFEINVVDESKDSIPETVLSAINNIDGIESVDIGTADAKLYFDKDLMMPFVEHDFKMFNKQNKLDDYLKSISDNNNMVDINVIGVDDDIIDKYNKDADKKIDVQSFKDGKMCLTYWFSNYNENDDSKGKSFEFNDKNGEKRKFDITTIKYDNLLATSMPIELGMPVIYVSNSCMGDIGDNIRKIQVRIYAEKGREYEVQNKVKNEVNGYDSLESKSKIDVEQEFNKTLVSLKILSFGIYSILILIGLLNFVNVMITGVNSRLKEFAIMESIGMTKKQIKKMLTFEGLYYGGLTVLNILIIGTPIIYTVAHFTKVVVDYAVFNFPFAEIGFISVLILIICCIVPSIVFKFLSKKTVTERLRNIEV